jgi:antitoxin (DNA-binding transcriptional repressor) of toxin-antitoxin stability system
MAAVDAQGLEGRIAEILRRLREEGEPIDITDQGRLIARLVPAAPPRPSREDIEAWWAEHDRLAEEIGRDWPEGVSAVEAVREQRREL